MTIPFRALQHYAYCPHRWGMLYLEGMWQENALTVRGDILHERIHTERRLSQNKGREVYGGVSLYSLSLGIYGKADGLELAQDKVRLIEYKPTAPKREPNAADRLQLYAQYRCAAELFGKETEAYFYYSDTRRRMRVLFGEEDETLLLCTIEGIRTAAEAGILPPVVRQKGCGGCSMAERCMPRAEVSDVRGAIRRSLCENC